MQLIQVVITQVQFGQGLFLFLPVSVELLWLNLVFARQAVQITETVIDLLQAVRIDIDLIQVTLQRVAGFFQLDMRLTQ